MPTSVASIFSDAIAHAHPYVSEYAVAPGLLLRSLTMLDREVMQLYAISAPERLSFAGAPLTVTSSSNQNGYNLVGSAGHYLDFRWMDKDGVVYQPPIRIVPESQFDNPPQHPAGIIRRDTFFPCDPLNKRWVGSEVRDFFIGDGDKIQYRYVQLPTATLQLTGTTSCPDDARDYLVWSLTFRILSAHPLAPKERREEALAQAQSAKRDLALIAMKYTETQGSTGSGGY